MKKITLFTLGLCLFLNQISFGASKFESPLRDNIPHLEGLRDHVATLSTAGLLSAYKESPEDRRQTYGHTSDPADLFLKMTREQRTALVEIVRTNRGNEVAQNLLRIALNAQEPGSKLSGLRSFSGTELQSLWDLMQESVPSRKDASSSKNIAAILLPFSGSKVKASESGFLGQVTELIGARILDILNYDLTAAGLTRSSGSDRWEVINDILKYVQDMWIDDSDDSEAETIFKTQKKSHFLDTINAAKILMAAKNNLVTFKSTAFTSAQKDIVIYSGRLHEILSTLQIIYDETDIPGSIANHYFEDSFKNLIEITHEISDKIASGEIFTSSILEEYAGFSSIEGATPLIISGGKIHPILEFLKKYSQVSTLPNLKKAVSNTKKAIMEFDEFNKIVAKNLERNIASRRCSEQQLFHHIWGLKDEIKEALEQGETLSPLCMATDRSPCTTCLMTSGRFNYKMSRFLGVEFCSVITYREQYEVTSKESALYEMAQKFAAERNVRIIKTTDIMGSPLGSRHSEGTEAVTESAKKDLDSLVKAARGHAAPPELGNVAKALNFGADIPEDGEDATAIGESEHK